jgi:chaperonin GroES
VATKGKKKKPAAKKAASKVTTITSAKRAKAKKSAPKRAPAKKVASTPKSSGKVISLARARENRPSKVDWNSYLTPIDDRVLVELVKPAEKTAGGLFIPDMAQERSNNGRVVAVGPGKRDKKGRRRPLDVRVGEKIMYAEYTGSKLQLEGRNLLLINESDILGIVES